MRLIVATFYLSGGDFPGACIASYICSVLTEYVRLFPTLVLPYIVIISICSYLLEKGEEICPI